MNSYAFQRHLSQFARADYKEVEDDKDEEMDTSLQ